MAIAVFGNKMFVVTSSKIITFNDFQYGSTLETEKQDAAGKKPSTYNKGPGLDTLSIKIRLSADLGVNPRNQLGEWLKVKDAGVAYPFILGGKPFRPNKWLLVDVQASEGVIDNDGNFLALTLSLSFDEYVRPGSKTEKSTSGTGKSKVQIKVPTLTASEKAQLK